MFYLIYAVTLLVLAPFTAAGKGWGGFIFFFLFSMALPVVGPLLWAWLWARGKSPLHHRHSYSCSLPRDGVALRPGLKLLSFIFACSAVIFAL